MTKNSGGSVRQSISQWLTVLQSRRIASGMSETVTSAACKGATKRLKGLSINGLFSHHIKDRAVSEAVLSATGRPLTRNASALGCVSSEDASSTFRPNRTAHLPILAEPAAHA